MVRMERPRSIAAGGKAPVTAGYTAKPRPCHTERMSCRRLVACVGAWLSPLRRGRHSAAQPSRERPTVHATPTSEAPKIDGVLDEAVWQSAHRSTPSRSRSRTKASRRPSAPRCASCTTASTSTSASTPTRRAGRRHRDAARRRPAVRRRQLPGHPRHVPRLAQRLHVPDDAARREARAAGVRRRRGRRPRHDLERQSQLGRRVGHRRADRQRRLDRGDRDSRQHACASPRATSRPGASTSSATSAARTKRCSGRRFRRPTA